MVQASYLFPPTVSSAEKALGKLFWFPHVEGNPSPRSQVQSEMQETVWLWSSMSAPSRTLSLSQLWVLLHSRSGVAQQTGHCCQGLVHKSSSGRHRGSSPLGITEKWVDHGGKLGCVMKGARSKVCTRKQQLIWKSAHAYLAFKKG
jgi:hypothetical protein